jgi:hypothetical protein
MKTRQLLNACWWCLPISLYSLDANAWGLYTHVYFAQTLFLASPLLDKRFREAVKRFPELVMAGACLPDLAVISKQFKTTHQWGHVEFLINHATTDEQTAVAIGYASHLYVDVIAHNHFVPAHEALWQHESIFTHIAAEWAMDVHVQRLLHQTPGQLLAKHAAFISHFIAPCFDQPQRLINRKLRTLGYADQLLRALSYRILFIGASISIIIKNIDILIITLTKQKRPSKISIGFSMDTYQTGYLREALLMIYQG